MIRSHTDLAPGFACPTGYDLATPDRVLMCEPVPLPYESSGFALRAPPPGSFVSRGCRGQAVLEARPTRAGLQADLNLHFYIGPAWSMVPVPGLQPDRLSALQVGDGGRVAGWRLAPAQAAMGSFEGD